MSAAAMNALKKVPFPLFGTAATAIAFTTRKASILPKLAPWGLPLGLGGLWFVWPAVDEEWKQSFSAPAAPAAAAPEEKKVELSEEAIEKIDKAYVVEVKELTEVEKAVVKATAGGDFSLLEKEWDTFQEKASNPNEDDDDDDEDDDDDDDEEEEEGEEGDDDDEE